MKIKTMFHHFTFFLKSFKDYVILTEGVLASILFILFILGCLISFIEDLPLREALYFTAITGLTVGYGDIVPQTSLGRLISVLIGVTGLIFFGIVIGVATAAVKSTIKNFRK